MDYRLFYRKFGQSLRNCSIATTIIYLKTRPHKVYVFDLKDRSHHLTYDSFLRIKMI